MKLSSGRQKLGFPHTHALFQVVPPQGGVLGGPPSLRTWVFGKREAQQCQLSLNMDYGLDSSHSGE